MLENLMDDLVQNFYTGQEIVVYSEDFKNFFNFNYKIKDITKEGHIIVANEHGNKIRFNKFGVEINQMGVEMGDNYSSHSLSADVVAYRKQEKIQKQIDQAYMKLCSISSVRPPTPTTKTKDSMQVYLNTVETLLTEASDAVAAIDE